MNRPLRRSEVMKARTKSTRALLLLPLAVGAAAAGLATGVVGSGGSAGPARASAAQLEAFDSCEDILDHVRDHRWALGRHPYGPVALEAIDGDLAVATRERAAASNQSSPDEVGPSGTGTNVQEEGIDEPDIVKLDGDVLYVVERGTLQAFDVAGDDPALLSELELPGRRDRGPQLPSELELPGRWDVEPQLLLAGERLLVLESFSERPEWTEKTRLTEIDVSDPAAPAALRTAEIEGAQVSARLRGTTAHLVVASTPDYPVGRDRPEPPHAPATAEDAPSGATGATGPGPEPDGAPGWLPQMTQTDLATGEATTGPLFDCDAVSFPKRFAGLDLLSVLTIDTEAGLEPADVDTVMTNGQTVYASATSLYVATETMPGPQNGVIGSIGGRIAPDILPEPAFPGETAIHRFDTTEPRASEYAASGEVEGRLLNEWSLSEHDGYLRVAATEGDQWATGQNESETAVTVLAERDGELRTAGRVGGLGRGERIFGVRFIDEMGYVVTFEQTDPLYAIDLGDPEAPRATGELKIPGYSAYLHPVAEGKLLGIGQAGTQDGVLTGAQASLFDIGDPRSPERVDTLDLAGGRYGSSQTEWDHHAFLYWPAERLAVVPVESYGPERFRGAVAMRVGDERLTELARLRDGRGPIRRMLVAGDRLITVSAGGVASRPLATLRPRSRSARAAPR